MRTAASDEASERSRALEAEIAAHGGEEFVRRGHDWVRYFRELAALEPTESVLDVGCGIGRVAVPLTSYLAPSARYEGFDIVPDKVRWAQEHITPRFPNFGFALADVHNERFNPSGTVSPSEFRFPYEDGSFDLVCVITVFSQMLPEDVEHYFGEITRVLREGGRMVASFLLVNDEALRLLEQSADHRRDPARTAREARFGHDFGDYRLTDPAVPEALVAHDERYVLSLCERFGLELATEIRYGQWPGRADGAQNHDFLVARLLAKLD